MSLKYLFLIVFVSMFNLSVQAQVKNKDSTQIYKKIKTYSKRNKFTKSLHDLIFESPDEEKDKKEGKKVKSKKKYSSLQGKTIKKIDIETLDPFGYSIEDSTKKPENWISEFGNKFHIKTTNLAIKNLLLFNEQSPLDILLLNESERLIRSQSYIRSVNIDVEKANKTSDSVDVKIRVLDSWSLIVNGAISTSKTIIIIKERNFLGLGHEFNNTVKKGMMKII